MCGASSEQKSLEAKQAAFYDTMTAQYKVAFAKSSAILDSLTKVFQPIFDKGPNQRGFSDEQRTDLKTMATESVAKGYAGAQRTLQGQLAARGGSDFIPSGADTQMSEGLSALAANERSALNLQIEQADWAAGLDLWKTAAGGLGGVAAQWDPTGMGNMATNAGNAAANTANQIAAADNSIWSSVIGGLSGVAGAAVGGYMQGLGKSQGSSSGGG
jgi:hypothetical protein